MKLFLSALILLWTASVFGADGDVTGVAIESNGWVADIYMTSVGAANTNGALINGLTTAVPFLNYSNYWALSGVERLRVNVTSLGWNSDGTANTVTRTLYGMRLLRQPYPAQAFSDTTNSANVLKIKAVLSGRVYPSDSITSAVLLSGLYATNSFTSAASTWTTVTNSAAGIGDPKVIADFVLEDRRPVNSVQNIEVFAFHKYGTNFLPVARVEVTATGESSGHIESGAATTMIKSSRDGWPVYSVPLTLTTGQGFTRGEIVDISFRAFPFIGAAGVLDATTNAQANVWQLNPLKWTIMDKMIGVVDPATSDDSTGWAAVLQANADAHPFKTISGALTAIQGTNNTLFSLNRADGGEIQCKAGTYSVGKYSSQTIANGYFTITHHSSANRNNVIFDSFSTSQFQYPYQRFYDVTFSRSGSGFIVFAANPNVYVLERVNFFDNFGQWYSGDTATDITFLDCVTTNSFFSLGGNDGHSRLIRNCTYTNLTDGHLAWGNASVVFGCNGLGNSFDLWTPQATGRTNVIIAYNGWLAMTDSSFVNADVATVPVVNVAIVNNLCERIGSSATTLMQIEPVNGTAAFTNICIVGNTFIGQRCNFENDWITPANRFDIDWSMARNIFDRGNHRADIRGTSATLTGTWSIDNSVDCYGNWDQALSYAGEQDWWGLYCNSSFPDINFATGQRAGFLYDASQQGSNGGRGAYHVQSTGPTASLYQWAQALPYDLDQQPRTQNDPPGAFISATRIFSIQNARLQNVKINP